MTPDPDPNPNPNTNTNTNTNRASVGFWVIKAIWSL